MPDYIRPIEHVLQFPTHSTQLLTVSTPPSDPV